MLIFKIQVLLEKAPKPRKALPDLDLRAAASEGDLAAPGNLKI